MNNMSNEEPLHTNKEHFNYGSKPIRNEQTGIKPKQKEIINNTILYYRKYFDEQYPCDTDDSCGDNMPPIDRANMQYYDSLIIIHRILTAANVSSIDEVVALLERKRDSQGFLINTDVDDTMSNPLSDEEIGKLATDKGIWMDRYSFIHGYKAAANRKQAGWIDVNKDRQINYNGWAAMLISRDGIETTHIELVYNSIPYYYCTHWMPITLPLPPKPKQ